MSNTSEIWWNKIADDAVVEMLKVAIMAIEALKVEYFLVGAFARDVGMQARGYRDAPPRKTQDVDLAVMVGSMEEYEALKLHIAQLPDFVAGATSPYRFIFR